MADIKDILKQVQRIKFILEQEAKAARRKPIRAGVKLSEIRGTLFSGRNMRLGIRESALRQKQCIITYSKITTREINRYVVCPISYRYRKLHIGRRKMLFAWDVEDKHIKGFVLQRVRRVALTDRPYVRNAKKWPIEIA